eukprot:TRINITY_DN3149_c0_g1_i2.p1 TRINITY_DN3149_c0_g1~~TRINITY_DN3149_c0_g1_i2.p1  ORF type:complete len:211 (+),score=13.62 TRINITY_DN3149_c0_g1_i2:463-1095(+)
MLLLRQKQPLIIYPIFLISSLGVYISTDTSTSKVSYTGVTLILSSGLCLAMAVTLQQLILTREGLSTLPLHPMSLVFYTTPVEFLILGPLFFVLEFPSYDERDQSTIGFIPLTLLILVDASCVFLLRWVQNITIKSTSALTLTVISQFKFVIVITLSSLFFEYKLDLKKLIGLCLLMIGTTSYGVVRRRHTVKKPVVQAIPPSTSRIIVL